MLFALMRRVAMEMVKKIGSNVNDHRRGRTCNLLIRSQTRCHFARRPRGEVVVVSERIR